ncbi:MAG TPA: DUF4276 family protein [Pirellulales bacterium]|nr:DUF4276 family protein [Pirellulales bacterium]
METLVRRLSSLKLEVDHDRVSRGDIHAHHGKGQGFFKRALRWMLEARKRGYEALVLVVDEDGQAERVKEMTAAQESSLIAFRRALGIAVRTFDAWMLADEKALSSILGGEIERQPSPEGIHNPKQVCMKLRDECKADLAQSEMYAKLAEAIELPILEQRCARGFAPFAHRVKTL